MEIYNAITEVFQPKACFELNKVLDNLWITNVYTAKDADILRAKNIKHVVSLYPVDLEPEFNQLYIHVYDYQGADIQDHFEKTFNFIDEHINNGDNVVVHCHYGRSRAATIVIHYLMKKYKITFEKAYNYLKSKRSVIHPNPGFRLQLKKAEEKILSEKFSPVEDIVIQNLLESDSDGPKPYAKEINNQEVPKKF